MAVFTEKFLKLIISNRNSRNVGVAADLNMTLMRLIKSRTSTLNDHSKLTETGSS